MRYLLLFSIPLITICAKAQTLPDNSCPSTVPVEVVLDIVWAKPDTVKPDKNRPLFVCTGGTSNPSYILRPLDDKYTIISFMITTEDEDYIYTAPAYGNVFSVRGWQMFREAPIGSSIRFDCIKARDENGNIYVLKPFIYIRRQLYDTVNG